MLRVLVHKGLAKCINYQLKKKHMFTIMKTEER